MRWTISRQSLLGLAWVVCITLSTATTPGQSPAEALGVFENHRDIGVVLRPGSATFDNALSSYTINAGGDKIDGSADAFHFLWKKASGDISLTTTVTFPTNTGNSGKEAVLMIRQSLDADSPYIAANWGVAGLKSIQSRQEKSSVTQQLSIDGEGTTQVRLEKRGAHFFVYLARKGEKLHPAGAAWRLELAEPFYIGLGVCAHDQDSLESAVFSKVSLAAPSKTKLKLYSTLETISILSTNRHVIAVVPGRIEEPTFTLDGNAVLFKQGRTLKQIPITGGSVAPSTYPSTANIRKPGDKPSPDQQYRAHLSYWGAKPQDATLSLLTPGGGNNRALAEIIGGGGTLSNAPWSPDSKLLVFVSYQRVPPE
jgi:hypothetical protein